MPENERGKKQNTDPKALLNLQPEEEL